jgi:hypothetical protein
MVTIVGGAIRADCRLGGLAAGRSGSAGRSNGETDPARTAGELQSRAQTDASIGWTCTTSTTPVIALARARTNATATHGARHPGQLVAERLGTVVATAIPPPLRTEAGSSYRCEASVEAHEASPVHISSRSRRDHARDTDGLDDVLPPCAARDVAEKEVASSGESTGTDP